MIRPLVIAALLVASACGRQDQPVPAPANDAAASAPATPAPKAEVPLLQGTWSVAGASGLTARFSGGQAVLAEGCLRRAWTFTQKGNSVSFRPAPGGSSNCGRTPSAALEAAFMPLSDANLAVFNAGGDTVMLSGLGGSLQLKRR